MLRSRLAEAEETVRAIGTGNASGLFSPLSSIDDTYRTLIESMNEGALTLTRDDRILYANACFATMVQRPLEQVVGASFKEFLAEEDQALLDARLKSESADGSKVELILHFSDSSSMPVLISVHPLAQNGKESEIVAIVVTDITEQRRNEELLRRIQDLEGRMEAKTKLRESEQHFRTALRSSEIRYRRLFETAKDGVLILDGQTGKITEANPFILEVLGSTRPEVLGCELWEIGVFGDATASRAAMAELQNQGYLRYDDLPLESKTGQRHEVEVVANVYEEDGQRVIQCNIRDITERKQAEEKLHTSEIEIERARDYAEATLRTASVPLIVLRADLRVNTANEAFYKSFQVAPAETEGALIYDLGNRQWNIPRLRELLEEILPKNNFFNDFEITHEFETIGRRTMLLNARRMENESGQPLRIVLAIEDITERKQASQYARSLIEASLDPLVTISAEGKITDVNEGSIKVTGIVREKLIGTDFSDYFTEPEKAREGYQQVFAMGFITDYPLTIRHKDGRLTDVLYNASVYKDMSGNVLGIFAAARDITERKQASQYARSLIEASLDPLVTISAEGKITDVNEGSIKVTGIVREKLIGTDFSDYFTEPEKAREGYQQVFAMGFITDYPLTIRHKDGRLTDVLYNASVYKDMSGNVLGIFAAARDITERKQAEEALRKSEERFRVAALAVSNLIWTNNAQGMMEGEQLGWAQFTGQTLEEYQGYGWVRAVHPDDAQPTIEAWNTAVSEKRLFEFEHRIRRHDGTWRSCSIRAVPIYGEKGEIREWVGVHNDITERKRISAALIEAKEHAEAASSAKDEFLAALSHELRTPLNPVLMMATALAGDPSLPATLREQLDMMRRNIELEARLIDDLLDITRIIHGKLIITPVTADIHELLLHTDEIIRSDGLGKQLRIMMKLEAVKHHAQADPARLQQVFWNLLRNAVKFTPDGGSITVSSRNDAEGRIIISVADNGIGIRSEVLTKIFDAFEQADTNGEHRYGGLGLGLAISSAIITAHGAEIKAESQGRGHGAEFTVTLDSVSIPALTGPATAAPTQHVRTLSLLVVEDHEATRTVLEQLLTRSGHKITTASSLNDALSCYKAAHFDAVISDLGLPDGSGIDLMMQIQSIRPVPAIALSGYGMEGDLIRSKKAGFFAHLVKPVKVDQLKLLLTQIPTSAGHHDSA